MSIETTCGKCGEEFDMRHPRCPACGYDPTAPAIVTEEHIKFLDELRSSGEVDMRGAGGHLMKTFILDSDQARTVLDYWRYLRDPLA